MAVKNWTCACVYTSSITRTHARDLRTCYLMRGNTMELFAASVSEATQGSSPSRSSFARWTRSVNAATATVSYLIDKAVWCFSYAWVSCRSSWPLRSETPAEIACVDVWYTCSRHPGSCRLLPYRPHDAICSRANMPSHNITNDEHDQPTARNTTLTGKYDGIQLNYASLVRPYMIQYDTRNDRPTVTVCDATLYYPSD